MEKLVFFSTPKVKNTHPLLLQIVFHTAEFAEQLHLTFNIAKNYTPKLRELLGILRCSRLRSFFLDIYDEYDVLEEPELDEASVTSNLPDSKQKWVCDMEALYLTGVDNEEPFVPPAWLIGSPRRTLSLNMTRYSCLGKQEIESIRATELWISNPGHFDITQLMKDAIQKKEEGIANEKVSELRITWRLFPNKKEETQEYICNHLIWVAAQYPNIEKINVDSIYGNCDIIDGEIQDIFLRSAVQTVPAMEKLEELVIFRCRISLWDHKKWMPFGNIKFTDDFSSGIENMPFVIRPGHWEAFVSGKIEKQVNKQMQLDTDQEDYVAIKIWGSYKEKKEFECPICLNEFGEDKSTDWLYVSATCRHIYCLRCMIQSAKSNIGVFSQTIDPENTKCPVHRTPFLMNWKVCWRIEEEGEGRYVATRSRIEEKEILKVELLGNKSASP